MERDGGGFGWITGEEKIPMCRGFPSGVEQRHLR
jgi:hypothetical protein